MKYLDKLKLYSFTEAIQIIKASIASRILDRVPSGLRTVHGLISDLCEAGITISKTDKAISFRYQINNTFFKIFLERNSSDAEVFKQVIKGREYQIILDLLEKYKIPAN